MRGGEQTGMLTDLCSSSAGRGSAGPDLPAAHPESPAVASDETQPSEEELVLTVPYHRNSKSYSSKMNSTAVGQSYTNSSSNAGRHC